MIRKAAVYSNALMILTSIHHIYGAWFYKTPWRLHVLALSVPITIINGFLLKGVISRTKYYIFCFINFIASICLIGLYEGVYNHFLKNLLYFSGLNHDTLIKLFPPPMYELPNDFVFELTGIMQAVIVAPLLYHFVVLIKSKVATNTQ